MQVELDSLPSHSVDKMIRNRLLVHQIESTKEESEALETQIRKLEDINMDYITSSIEVDWNLMYGIEEYSDGDDYVFGLDDAEGADYLNEEEEWSLSDQEESDSADQLWDSIKPREQKYISRQPVDSIAKLANQIMQLEVQKRVTDPNLVGVSGQEIQLTKANMLTAGPIKYYESQIKASI